MSRDIKGTSLTELNDGLERAVKRCKRDLTSAIANAEENAIVAAVEITNDNLSKAQDAMKERVEMVSRNLSSRIENTQRNLGARIDQQARALANGIAELDKRHTKSLVELSDSVSRAMEAQQSSINSKLSGLEKKVGILGLGLKEVNQSLLNLYKSTNERFQTQQEEIIAIQSNIKTLLDGQLADKNSKLLAAGVALALLDTIRERTDVERFAPRHMLDGIAIKEKRLRNIKNNPDSITITDANNLIDDALVMENEAIRKRNEWETLHKIVLSSAIAVLKLLQSSSTIKVSSLYDESEEELKADYWTHGEYSRTMQEIINLKKKIENSPVDIAMLKGLQSEVDTLQHKAEELIIEASELGVLSEQRVIVSNEILNVMISQGWELKGDPDFMGGDEDSDWREGTFSILRKPNSGEEVSILVLPEDKDGKKGNQIIFHRNDDLIESAGAFQSRMEEIKREIEKSGYRLSSLHEPDHGDGKVEQLRSRDAMRRRGASEELKKALSNH